MSEKDIIVPKLVLKAVTVFDIKAFYKILKNWFSEFGYNVKEEEFTSVINEGTEIKWEASRFVDDYTKFIIKTTIKFNNVKYVETKKGKMTQAEVNVKLVSLIESDYQERWEKPTTKFLRGVYDKFIQSDKVGDYRKELINDTNNVFNEIKAYLNLQKLR